MGNPLKPVPNLFFLPQDSSGKGITTIPEKIGTAAKYFNIVCETLLFIQSG